MANGNGGARPPYGPWNTFENWLKEQRSHEVPPVRVDNTLLRHLSGSAQSQLRGALRFFELVSGENDLVTDRGRQVIASTGDKDQLKAMWAEIVPRAYESILEGVDLEAGTKGQLAEAFRDKGGLTGSVNDKALRFFLSAMENAGIQLSPHFQPTKTRTSTSNGQSKPRKARKRKVNPQGGTPENMQEILCSMPGGRSVKIWLPEDLTPGEEKFIVTYLNGYFELGRTDEDQEDGDEP